MQVQLRHGEVTAVSNKAPLDIPRDGYVVSGPLTPQLVALSKASFSERADLQFYTLPDWSDIKHGISGGPFLVKNNQVFIDAKEERFKFSPYKTRAPRSAAGITQNGKLLLVTVDGRQRGISVGVTLHQMAQLMKEFGAVHAMNLDGGSSTQMVVGNRLVNSPSVAHGAPVSTSLVIRQVPNSISKNSP